MWCGKLELPENTATQFDTCCTRWMCDRILRADMVFDSAGSTGTNGMVVLFMTGDANIALRKNLMAWFGRMDEAEVD